MPPGSQPIAADDVPNPRIRKFYSDHDNKAQKTSALWPWWGKLAPSMKDIIEAHVYREWPVLLDPSGDEKKFSDKIIGSEPIEHDQDFVDKYGAGDYHIYLNVNPAIGSRRTLAEAWIRCSHDFKKYPPTDRRIDDVTNVDLADPRNSTYVGWLRATGKIADNGIRKEEDMAQAALVDKLLDQNKDLMDRAIADAKSEPSVPSNGQAEAVNVVAEGAKKTQDMMLSTFQGLLATVQGGKGDSRGDLLNALEIAKVIASVNSPNTEKVEELRARLDDERDKRAEDNRQRIEELHRQELKALNEKLDRISTGGAPLQTVPTKSLIDQIKEAREMLAELGMDDDGPARNGSKMPWWAESFLPVIEKSLPQLLQMGTAFLMPRAPAPQQPPLHQSMQQPQPQQIPPPQQQQVGPQAVPPPQQQPPQANEEGAAIQRILVQISGPVVDYLSRDEGGDDFADWFCSEYGRRDYKLISKFSAEEITQALFSFQLTAPHMTQFQQAKVIEFSKAFREYDPDAYDAKMATQDKGGAA